MLGNSRKTYFYVPRFQSVKSNFADFDVLIVFALSRPHSVGQSVSNASRKDPKITALKNKSRIVTDRNIYFWNCSGTSFGTFVKCVKIVTYDSLPLTCGIGQIKTALRHVPWPDVAALAYRSLKPDQPSVGHRQEGV
ncbi:hypothetical protein AVEN_52023-1 [Araneus ventricosus]|uniref:Uncharacterized protein n=1 Tax=Araneus ventricosus TaxID=182803 RepID=A0A4Y2CFX2_ARAVE|nr:hypothetical protein AVEN_52023-1 [Araneus ventricosus]